MTTSHQPPPVAGRVPPHDLDAEAAVLSAILLSREAFEAVQAILRAEHFYSDANGHIYEAAQHLAAAGSPIDIVSVASWLRDRERLARIGGPTYLAQLADATPAVAHVAAHAKLVVDKWHRRQLIAALQRAAAEGYGDIGPDVGAWAEATLGGLRTLTDNALSAAEATDPFTGLWGTLRERGVNLVTAPKERPWLLKDLRSGEGALPLGKAGVVASAGGTGKTQMLLQLALAVALGKTWLGCFAVAKPGPVLIALAEEDLPEIVRRLYSAAAGLDLDATERDKALDLIVALPLAGNPVALTARDERGNTTTTAALTAVQRRLARAGHPWSLVILDPLSRWAGDNAEVENAAATRFVQAVETLLSAPGTPTVLVAHHSAKQAAKDGSASVRGVSGIVDGFRWAAVLDKVAAEIDGYPVTGVRMRHEKTNYTMPFGDVFLTWSRDDHAKNALVPANAAQRAALEKDATTDEAEREIRAMRAEAAKKNAETRAAEEARKAAKNGAPDARAGEPDEKEPRVDIS
jgi:DnaB-like helicase N terminal domain/AAA domain